MATIKVLFFASLREQLGKGEITFTADFPLSALQVWQQCSGEMQLPTNVLISLNHEYASSTSLVNAGDELAFFPPVTGG